MAADNVAHIEVFYDNGYEKHQVIPNKEMPKGILTEGEFAVMERVYMKFADYGSVDILNYSHKEKCYRATDSRHPSCFCGNQGSDRLKFCSSRPL